MRSRATVLALCLAIGSIARAGDPPGPLRVSTQPLGNGLRLVLAPDETVTDVVVHVRYAGMTDDVTPGMTHLIEKLAALGTVHRKAGEHDALIDAAGGFSTSSTTLDALSFVTQVPAEQLPLALWLEAERMAGLADGITETSVADAKVAIAGEYKAAYEIEPYALMPRAVRIAMFGADGAIARDPLGDGKSLDGVSIDEVRKVVRERIRPNRATVVIAGNFDVTAARQMVKRYFGWIPDDRHAYTEGRGLRSTSSPGTTTEIVDTTSTVVVAYRLPPHDSDDQTFSIYGHLLAGSPGTALVHTLVDAHLCTDVRVEVSRETLEVWATPAAGADLRQVASTIRATVLLPGAARVSVEQAQHAVELEQLLALENLAGRARRFATSPRAFPTGTKSSVARIPSRRTFEESNAITVIGHLVRP